MNPTWRNWIGLIFPLTIPLAVMLLALAISLTVWATDKSRERAACYLKAARVTDCPQPGAVERAVRWALD